MTDGTPTTLSQLFREAIRDGMYGTVLKVSGRSATS